MRAARQRDSLRTPSDVIAAIRETVTRGTRCATWLVVERPTLRVIGVEQSCRAPHEAGLVGPAAVVHRCHQCFPCAGHPSAPSLVVAHQELRMIDELVMWHG